MITTEGKTNYQIVDEIFTKLNEQGGRCEKRGNCLYGDGKGNHCAVGWLLEEGGTVMAFNDGVAELLDQHSDSELGPNAVYMRRNQILLEKLQVLHDHHADKDFVKTDYTSDIDELISGIPQSLKDWHNHQPEL